MTTVGVACGQIIRGHLAFPSAIELEVLTSHKLNKPWWCLVVLVVQRFGVGLVIERSLVRLPAGALSSQLGQLSLPSLRGR